MMLTIKAGADLSELNMTVPDSQVVVFERTSGPNRAIRPAEEIEAHVEPYQHGQGDQEDDPAFQAVKEAARQRRVDLAQNSGDGHPSGIGGDRDGYGGDKQHPSHPDALLEEISVHQREKRQRQQTANPATRFGDRKLLAG